MVKAGEIASIIEQYAPLSLQESYDNSGLMIGHYNEIVNSALICVDITNDVMDEAEELGCDMVISHHPLIFHPIKRLNGEGYVQKLVERAIKKGISLYACHTNLDSVEGGMSYKLAQQLGLGNIELLSQRSDDPVSGFGIIANTQTPVDPTEYLVHVKERLNIKSLRYSDICRDKIKTVALCTGAGSSLIKTAMDANADIYISSDFKYNDFIDADGRLIIADIGHFESEYCAIDLIYDIITKKLPTFALHKSAYSRNPINYLV